MTDFFPQSSNALNRLAVSSSVGSGITFFFIFFLTGVLASEKLEQSVGVERDTGNGEKDEREEEKDEDCDD